MSDRVNELAERRGALQLRCAAERRAVAREMSSIQARVGSVDRVAGAMRGVLLHPAVVAVGLVFLVAVGRARVFHLLGRGLLLATGIRRLLQVAKRI
jgi:hypothetical protein